MRTDIAIDTSTHDLALEDTFSGKTEQFRWVDTPPNMPSHFAYGEITVSNLKDAQSNGLYICIPYMPAYKPVMLQIKNSLGAIVANSRSTYPEWFEVYSKNDEQRWNRVNASELINISESRFFIEIKNNAAQLYSGVMFDFVIKDANIQNRDLLLQCVPGNSYRYPLNGVGLSRWVNSNLSKSDLADVLVAEFTEDGTPVKNAYYDQESAKLSLDLVIA